jgi:hypothetical protein
MRTARERDLAAQPRHIACTHRRHMRRALEDRHSIEISARLASSLVALAIAIGAVAMLGMFAT